MTDRQTQSDIYIHKVTEKHRQTERQIVNGIPQCGLDALPRHKEIQKQIKNRLTDRQAGKWCGSLHCIQTLSVAHAMLRTDNKCRQPLTWCLTIKVAYSFKRHEPTRRNSATDRQTITHCVFDGKKTVAYPASGCAVTTDVCKTSLWITIRCTERHFLYRLIHYQSLNTHNE